MDDYIKRDIEMRLICLLSSPELKSTVDGNKTTAFFEKECLIGSYPEPMLGVKDISKWYESYIQIYIVGSLREFTKFLRLLSGRPGQLLNMSSFATDVGVTIPTIKSWISILGNFWNADCFKKLFKKTTPCFVLFFTTKLFAQSG